MTDPTSTSLDDLDLESEQAQLLEEAYQLGYHKIKDGCLQEPLRKLNALIAQQIVKARVEALTEARWATAHMSRKDAHKFITDRISELQTKGDKDV